MLEFISELKLLDVYLDFPDFRLLCIISCGPAMNVDSLNEESHGLVREIVEFSR